jgi:hypothetical protein
MPVVNDTRIVSLRHVASCGCCRALHEAEWQPLQRDVSHRALDYGESGHDHNYCGVALRILACAVVGMHLPVLINSGGPFAPRAPLARQSRPEAEQKDFDPTLWDD